MLHPDLLRLAYDRRDELLSEAARDRVADAFPRASATPRVALSHLLRKMADALDPAYAGAGVATSGVATSGSETLSAA